MNTKFLSVSMNTKETITLPANIIEVEQTTVVVQQLLQDHPKTIFIKLKHQQLNTLLVLNNVAPYELWYFNEKEEFTGKSACLHNGNAPFQIITQARCVALVPVGIQYTLVSMNNTKDKKFILSETYLPKSESYAIERANWTLSLFNVTDQELINTYNNETQKKGWIEARSYYLKCLQEEIKNRSFNSEILFGLNSNGTIATFSLKNKVQLVNNTLEFKI
jgi:hypothetical protein